jgi:CRISPR system Cascade subunit CasC
MFVQIHMLQSMPPGNLNRDESGQPKRCLFGGVTRGRISSQCLKRNIRKSDQFKEAFSGKLADRTKDLPKMVADVLEKRESAISGDLDELMLALAAKFKRDESDRDSDEESEKQSGSNPAKKSDSGEENCGMTRQLVFFPETFATRVAELVFELRGSDPIAYNRFLGRKEQKKGEKKKKDEHDKRIAQFVKDVRFASEKLTIDIGLFGRMTTSDLLVNVEAACQVAHAISTHEVMVESDYFTAMDDRSEKPGAAYMGTGGDRTFFNSAVYYKYLNLDVNALMKHLPSMTSQDAGNAAAILVSAAVHAYPTGKQNAFASFGVPELILIELTKSKRPISYANAFLQAVEGGIGINLMKESAKALQEYIGSVVTAFESEDLRRLLLAVGPASIEITNARKVEKLEKLLESVANQVSEQLKAEATA